MEQTGKDQSALILYRGYLDPGRYVWSSFVNKLETRFRFAGVPYVTEAGSIQQAPKGKIPYIEWRGRMPDPLKFDENSSGFLGDSAFIIKRLVDCDVLPDINDKLAPAVQAQDLAIRALIEDKLYFYRNRELWMENFYPMRDQVLQTLAYPMRVIVGLIIYRNIKQTLHGQGTGRYTAAEVAALRKEVWESLNALLETSNPPGSDKPFWVLGGEGPTEADASLFGFIVSVLVASACPESQKLVRTHPVILDYAGRIHDVYFPDYEKWE